MKAMPNPYKKDKQQCVLCKYEVHLDYKVRTHGELLVNNRNNSYLLVIIPIYLFQNARLLSQFVSRFTGKVYDRQTTGLCKMQDEKLRKVIKMARVAGKNLD